MSKRSPRRPSQRAPNHPRRCRGDEGTALVEFSLLLPFLSIMVLGTVDVGRAYALKNRLTNMARQGAFQAQYYPGMVGAPTCTGVTSIVRAALAEDTDLRNATVTVTNLTSGSSVTGCSAPPNAPPSGTRLRVTVTGPMAVLTPLAAAWTGSTARITGYEDVVVQ